MTVDRTDRLVVAKTEEIPEGGRLVVKVGALEIGIFRIHGDLRAYENYCAHQGGPVCQGTIMNRVVELIDGQHRSVGEDFSEDDVHIVCPWHGYEYNLETGEHPGNPRIRLKSHVVSEREGEISVQF